MLSKTMTQKYVYLHKKTFLFSYPVLKQFPLAIFVHSYAMETAGLFVSFSSAIQHTKNCFGGEKLVLKSKQVNVLRAF